MEVKRAFDTAEVRAIEINLTMGDVRIDAANDEQIRLRARIRSNDEAELEAAIIEGELRIGNGNPDWPGYARRIDVELALPASLDVPIRVRSGKGDVSVDRVRGLRHVHTGKGDVALAGGASSVDVHTGMGDLAVSSWRGDLSIQTGRGSVAASKVDGGLAVHTGSGDVAIRDWRVPRADDSAGRCSIETGSGDVVIDDVQAQALTIHTGRGDCTLSHASLATVKVRAGSGDVALDGQPAAGQWDVHTGRGDISLRVPALAAVRIEAATRHGEISSDLPQVKVGRPGPVSQHGGRSIGVLGNEPRAEILLETGKGDISVRTLRAPATTVVVEPPTHAMPETKRPPEPAPIEMVLASSSATALTILESLSRGEISVSEAETLLRSLEPA